MRRGFVFVGNGVQSFKFALPFLRGYCRHYDKLPIVELNLW